MQAVEIVLRRLCGGGRLRQWSVALALLFMTTGVEAADPHDSATLAATKVGFEHWLAAVGLSDTFAVEKVRWGSRPEASALRWLKLELRYVTTESDQAREDEQLQGLFEKYEGIAGVSLAESLFYKFVHLSGASRADAVVYIFVLDRDYAIYHDKQEGRLVFREGIERGFIRRVVVLDNHLQKTPGRKADATLPMGIGQGDAAARIQSFLQDYFTARNRRAGLGTPKFTLEPLESNYAGLEVEGIKSLVVTKKEYWEFLQISIDLQPGSQGLRATCYISGNYASGSGTKRWPARDVKNDIEGDYRAELEAFIATLLRELQAFTAKPR